VGLAALLVPLLITAQLVKMLPSFLEAVSALTVLIHAILVMQLEHAPAVSVDSTSSKVPAKLPVLLELFPLTGSVDALQVSFLTVNV